VALLAAGVGGAARGGYGLLNLIRRNLRKPKPVQVTADMPLPFAMGDEEEEKVAFIKDIVDRVKSSPITDKASLPYYYPGMMLGGLAAGAGGWAAIDKILDARRKAAMKDEVTEKKREFETALIGSYDKPFDAKQAGDEALVKLAADLDALFDRLQEKRATIGDLTGQAAGMYGMYAIPASLIAGYAAYSMGKKRQRKAVLKKALKKRNLRRFTQQPPPVYATPVPAEEEEGPIQQ